MANSSCLWAKARENLPADVNEWLASLEQGIQPIATATKQIDALIEQTTTKQKDLEKSNHRFTKYFDKIIHWLDKVKGIGDVISSFDPVHAALPWAAFRFALQAILSEREQAENVLELLASTPHFAFSGRVLEMVYTRESMHTGETENDVKLSQQCLDSLHEELIKLYSELLGALKYCYSISSKHKIQRKATAIFNSSEVVSIHQDLEVQHRKVIACGENCHKILNHTLSHKSLDMLQKIQPTLTELGDRVQKLLVRMDESERRNTLGAISSILFRAHHDEVSRRRTVGTCEWILKRETFIRWEESDSSVTILYGSPGAGKTFLVSKVVDHSIERAETGEAVAFFYCKRDEENRRNPQDILRSILRQLSSPVKKSDCGMIHVAVKDLPNRLALEGTTFDISICESLIGKLIKHYPRTTIILDALDECDRSTREDLMRVVSNLTNQGSKVRVFISSRHDEDILRHFKDTPVMMIQATDNGEDISSFVENKLFGDTRWADIGPKLQEEVKSVFHKKSQGMFQWAALQVDQIRRLRIWSEQSMRKELQISPIGLKGAYDVVWNQIQEMSPYEGQLAKRALQWALCSFEPLETSDLLLLMQIEPSSGIIEADTAFTPETIQSICGNLLVYDRKSNVWRFSHLSAREYIETHHFTMLESHYHAATSSIRFIKRYLVQVPQNTEYNRYSQPPLWVVQRTGSRLGDPSNKFRVQCRYIVGYVLWHVYEIDMPTFRYSELSYLLRKFFEPISQGSSSFQAWKRHLVAMENYRWRLRRNWSGFSPPLQISSTPLQVMSIYGLFDIVRDLWEGAGDEVNLFPEFSPSPLALTIMYRHESIWQFLMHARAEINNGAQGPLEAAIECNNIIAFEAMLKAGADVNYVHPTRQLPRGLKDPYERRADTPLKAALWHLRSPTQSYFIQRLLDEGADVNLRTRTRTTLELAVQFTHEEAVRILLDANTEAYNPDHLLSLAARNRFFNLIPLFLSLGASIEEPLEGVLPLVWALRMWNLSAVQSLLEVSGTSIDLSCQHHREAISSILGRPDVRSILRSLSESDSHINWMGCETDTLRRALRSYPKYESEIRGLGFNGSDFALQCIEGTAHRQLSLVHTLLNAGADASVSVDISSGSTLTAADFHGRLHHVRALLDQETSDVKQDQRDLFRTALFTLMSGHLGMVSWKSLSGQRRPFGNKCLCPKYLEVLQLLFNGDLSGYIPLYEVLDPLIPPVYVNGQDFEINKPSRLYVQDYFGCFSRLWFSIIWDLQNSTYPQLPLGSQLRQWQFPGILPLRCCIVTKVNALCRDRPTYLIKLFIRGSRSQFIVSATPREVLRSLSHGWEDRRWKRYKAERFGIVKFPASDDGALSSDTQAPSACGRFEVRLAFCHRNIFALVLLALVVGLVSGFISLLLSATNRL